MISVFSNYLEPLREANLVALTDDCNVSEIYDWLRIAYNQGSPGILNSIRIISPIDDIEERSDIYDKVHSNKDLLNIVRWINKKITLCIGEQDYRTLSVRLSIADNMIIKLVESGDLSKLWYNKIHFYLCNNVWNEQRLIVNENLPF